MLTNADALSLIVSNLGDLRCSGIALQLNRLLTHDVLSGENRLFRAGDPLVPITDFDDLTAAITASDASAVTLTPSLAGPRFSSGTLPVVVTIPGIVLKLFPKRNVDQEFVELYGVRSHEEERVMRVFLAYLNDNDSALPLKVTNVSFVLPGA